MLASDYVSALHDVLERRGQRIRVIDQESRNGTLYAGRLAPMRTGRSSWSEPVETRRESGCRTWTWLKTKIRLHVDHIVELQLTTRGDREWANSMASFELLDEVERQERAVHHVIQRGAYVEGDAVVNHGGANAADHILLHAVVMISHDDHAHPAWFSSMAARSDANASLAARQAWVCSAVSVPP